MQVKFEINDYYELLALHRTIMEAKFHKNPDNTYILPSPLIADISNRIIDCIMNYHSERNEENKVKDWHKFIEGNPGDWIWERILQYAINDEEWNKMKDDELKKYVQNLMSPFKYTDQMIESFIHTVKQIRNSP